MVELGRLEENHAAFSARNARIVAASLDDREHSALVQEKFPNLIIVSDVKRSLAEAANVIGEHQSPEGQPTVDPTTFLIDRTGKVRAILRAERYVERFTPEELLERLKQN